MKHVLLLLMLVVSSVALAQQQSSIALLMNQSTISQKLNAQEVLQGGINPRGFTLIKSAMLYRNLADTINKKAALRLSYGDNVIIQRQMGHWIKVVRGNKAATSFTRDTSSYYIPASAKEGTKTFVLL